MVSLSSWQKTPRNTSPARRSLRLQPRKSPRSRRQYGVANGRPVNCLQRDVETPSAWVRLSYTRTRRLLGAYTNGLGVKVANPAGTSQHAVSWIRAGAVAMVPSTTIVWLPGYLASARLSGNVAKNLGRDVGKRRVAGRAKETWNRVALGVMVMWRGCDEWRCTVVYGAPLGADATRRIRRYHVKERRHALTRVRNVAVCILRANCQNSAEFSIFGLFVESFFLADFCVNYSRWWPNPEKFSPVCVWKLGFGCHKGGPGGAFVTVQAVHRTHDRDTRGRGPFDGGGDDRRDTPLRVAELDDLHIPCLPVHCLLPSGRRERESCAAAHGGASILRQRVCGGGGGLRSSCDLYPRVNRVFKRFVLG